MYSPNYKGKERDSRIQHFVIAGDAWGLESRTELKHVHTILAPSVGSESA